MRSLELSENGVSLKEFTSQLREYEIMFRWWLSGRILMYSLHFRVHGSLGCPRSAESGTSLTRYPRTVRRRTFNNYISYPLRKISHFNNFTYRQVLRRIPSVFRNSSHELSSYPWSDTNLSHNLTSGASQSLIPRRISDDASHSFRRMATTRNKSRLLLLCEVLLIRPQNSVEENTTKKVGIAKYIVILYL
jgi:hypothetical protein